MKQNTKYYIKEIVALLPVSRQAYYMQLQKSDEKKVIEKIVLQLAEIEVTKFKNIGIDKLYYSISPALHFQGIKYGRDKFRKLMQSVTFRKKQRNRRKTVYIVNHKKEEKYNNLIKGAVLTERNQIWQIDITQLKYNGLNMYMTAIIEARSRKLISHVISTATTSRETSIKALEKGLLYGKPKIIHSDRGTQFTSDEWKDMLSKLSIERSYSSAGTPTENGKIERLFSTLKTELEMRQIKTNSIEDYLKKIDAIVNKYNSERVHQSLNFRTPDSVFYNIL